MDLDTSTQLPYNHALRTGPPYDSGKCKSIYSGVFTLGVAVIAMALAIVAAVT